MFLEVIKNDIYILLYNLGECVYKIKEIMVKLYNETQQVEKVNIIFLRWRI